MLGQSYSAATLKGIYCRQSVTNLWTETRLEIFFPVHLSNAQF